MSVVIALQTTIKIAYDMLMAGQQGSLGLVELKSVLGELLVSCVEFVQKGTGHESLVNSLRPLLPISLQIALSIKDEAVFSHATFIVFAVFFMIPAKDMMNVLASPTGLNVDPAVRHNSTQTAPHSSSSST